MNVASLFEKGTYLIDLLGQFMSGRGKVSNISGFIISKACYMGISEMLPVGNGVQMKAIIVGQ